MVVDRKSASDPQSIKAHTGFPLIRAVMTIGLGTTLLKSCTFIAVHSTVSIAGDMACFDLNPFVQIAPTVTSGSPSEVSGTLFSRKVKYSRQA